MMTKIAAVRLSDVPQTEDRGKYGGQYGFGTSFQASDTCEIWRDELGWIHVDIGNEVTRDDGAGKIVIWRPCTLAVPPNMVKFIDYPSARAMPAATTNLRQAKAAQAAPKRIGNNGG